MNIGKAIVDLCKTKGITRKELAVRMGMSQNAVSSLVKGKTWPTEATMTKLTKAFDIPQSYILLYSIEESDIPEDKRDLYCLLVKPMKEYLMK